MIEPLARYDENGSLVAWLAETVPTVANGGVAADLKAGLGETEPATRGHAADTRGLRMKQCRTDTKHRSSRPGRRAEPGARLYRLDTRHTDRPNVLTLVDQHDQITFATGADVSPDGGLLAVISYSDLWLFRAPEDGSDRWLSSQAIRIPLDTSVLRQVEAITWDGADSLLLGNEQRELFRLSLDELGIVPR